MFEPFRFGRMQYLAIPRGNYVLVISFIGLSYGLWESIDKFKKACPINGNRYYKISVDLVDDFSSINNGD
jgi:hypothetical protein